MQNTDPKHEKKAELVPSSKGLSVETINKIKNFEQGDVDSLDSVDIISIIAQHIFNLYNKGDMRFALILLENLGEWSRSDNIEHRERSLMAISLICEKVLEEDNEDFLESLSRILIKWLKYETEYIAGFEFICVQLRKMVLRMLRLGLWYQTEDLIAVIYKIKKGVIKKSKVFTQVIAKLHNSLADKPFIETLTNTYINEESVRRDIAGTLLVNFGDRSAYHLLYTLCNCPNKEQRLNLIEILPATGAEALPGLIELLQKKPPWYVLRNIILILSKMADPSLFHLVQPYMTHKDIRVQQEVIDCVRRMNGNKMTDRLLDALEVCNDKLKPQIIRILAPLENKKIGLSFANILETPPTCDQLVKDEIIKEICINLQSFPSPQALHALEVFISEENKRPDISAETLTIAETTYLLIEQEVEQLDTIAEESDQSNENQEEDHFFVIEDASKTSEDVDLSHSSDNGITQQLLTEDESSSEQIKTDDEGAENKAETGAENDWLTQYIENSDTPSSFKQHVTDRNDFYMLFNKDEFSAFMSLLHHRTFTKGEVLVEIGDIHSNLFFIDSGSVHLAIPESNTEMYIQDLQKGDVCGNDIFMLGSEWNVSLVASSESEIFIFDQEQLLKMQPRFPELALKILAYCKYHDTTLGLLRMAEKRRPTQQTEGKISFTGNSGEVIADVELIEISEIGFCFCLNLPKGFRHTLFSDKKFTAFFSSDSDQTETIEGQFIGLQFNESDNCKLYLFAKFLEHQDVSGLTCSRIGLR